jgi:stage IV sporulation protein FB
MIKVHVSFIVLACALTAAGWGSLFLLLFASLTLHELTHVMTATYFGGRLERIHLTALGEAAVIRGLDNLFIWQRYLVFLSGPCMNILLAFASYALGLHQFSFYNAVLGVFNLLPVFPLDGGRVLHLFLGNRIGVLRANRLMVKMGKAAGLLLLLPGCVQVVLFPYNISLICAGMYIKRKNEKLMLPMTAAFFQFLLNKKKQGLYPVKYIHAQDNTPLQYLAERIGWDNIIYIKTKDREISEWELTSCFFENGLAGDLAKLSNCPC